MQGTEEVREVAGMVQRRHSWILPSPSVQEGKEPPLLSFLLLSEPPRSAFWVPKHSCRSVTSLLHPLPIPTQPWARWPPFLSFTTGRQPRALALLTCFLGLLSLSQQLFPSFWELRGCCGEKLPAGRGRCTNLAAYSEVTATWLNTLVHRVLHSLQVSSRCSVLHASSPAGHGDTTPCV